LPSEPSVDGPVSRVDGSRALVLGVEGGAVEGLCGSDLFSPGVRSLEPLVGIRSSPADSSGVLVSGLGGGAMSPGVWVLNRLCLAGRSRSRGSARESEASTSALFDGLEASIGRSKSWISILPVGSEGGRDGGWVIAGATWPEQPGINPRSRSSEMLGSSGIQQ